jgi:hypothetical protein
MGESEQEALAEIRTALREPYVALHVVNTFTHGQGIQVQVRSHKIGPILFPAEGRGVGSVLEMLGQMLDDNDETTNDGETDART